MFYYKSGSSTRAVLVGRAASVRKAAGRDGRTYTSITIVTREAYKGRDGVMKECEHVVPVYVEGENASIEEGSIVTARGDLSVCVVVQRSEAQKWEVSQEAVRNARVEVLSAPIAREEASISASVSTSTPSSTSSSTALSGINGINGINEAVLIGRVGSVRALRGASSTGNSGQSDLPGVSGVPSVSGVSIRLAVSRTEMTKMTETTNEKDEKDKKGSRGYASATDWHEVLFWGKRAESIQKLGIGKGDSLLVKGKLSLRTAKVSKEAGTERKLLTFLAEDFNLLNRCEKHSASVPACSAESDKSASKAPFDADESVSDSSEEAPFF